MSAFTKERHGNTRGAPNNPIGEKAHDVAIGESLHDSSASLRAHGYHSHPQRLAERTKPIEQLWWLDLLDYCGDLVSLHFGEPKSCPLPSTEMWEDKDRADSALEWIGDVVIPRVRKACIYLLGAERWKAKAIEVVTTVVGKRLSNLGLAFSSGELTAIDAFKICLLYTSDAADE